MKEKFVDYGTVHKVEVISSSKHFIACHSKDINEGFILIGHGIEDLPKVGDVGKVVFERDNRRGHWQYYPSAAIDSTKVK